MACTEKVADAKIFCLWNNFSSSITLGVLAHTSTKKVIFTWHLLPLQLVRFVIDISILT